MTQDKAALVELAERCEAAEGPSRELDALIWCALNGKRYAGHNEAYAAYGSHNPETQVEYTEPPKRKRLVTTRNHARPWTASLDAALTLVPGGWSVKLTIHNGEDWAEVYKLGEIIETTTGLIRPYASGGSPLEAGPSATPALALCAAALRALANQEQPK